MTEMFGEAWPPMSVPDLAPDDDDNDHNGVLFAWRYPRSCSVRGGIFVLETGVGVRGEVGGGGGKGIITKFDFR